MQQQTSTNDQNSRTDTEEVERVNIGSPNLPPAVTQSDVEPRGEPRTPTKEEIKKMKEEEQFVRDVVEIMHEKGLEVNEIEKAEAIVEARQD